MSESQLYLLEYKTILINMLVGGTSGAGTVYHTGTSEVLPYFSKVCGAENGLFFVLFLFAVVLSVPRCTGWST